MTVEYMEHDQGGILVWQTAVYQQHKFLCDKQEQQCKLSTTQFMEIALSSEVNNT